MLLLALLVFSASVLGPYMRGLSSSKRASTLTRPLRVRLRSEKKRWIKNKRSAVGTDSGVRGTSDKRGDKHFSNRGGLSLSFLLPPTSAKKAYMTIAEMRAIMSAHPHPSIAPTKQSLVEQYPGRTPATNARFWLKP